METIKGGKLFKGRNYSWKYSNLDKVEQTILSKCCPHFILTNNFILNSTKFYQDKVKIILYGHTVFLDKIYIGLEGA